MERFGFAKPETSALSTQEGTPTIRKTAFFKNRTEEVLYEDVVARNPIQQGETRFAYIVRIAELAKTEYEKLEAKHGRL